jgi:uncharacterized lipoprotein YmbA
VTCTLPSPLALWPALVLGMLCSVGCGSTPEARHFVLVPLAEAPPPGGPAALVDLALSLGPVTLPAYLDRPQMVVDIGGQERRVDELTRWAEPLDRGLARVLAIDLAQLLGTEQLSLFPPHPPSPPDHRVELDVVRFEIVLPDSAAVLDARWRLFGAGQDLLRTRREHFVHALAPGDAPESEQVRALSACVAELARAIAAQIRVQQAGD